MEGVQVKKEKANMQRDSSRSLEYNMDGWVVLDNFHHDITALGDCSKTKRSRCWQVQLAADVHHAMASGMSE